MNKVAVVPTLLTLGNLFCGFTAVTYVIDGTLEGRHVETHKLVWAAWCVFFAMIFDALDGRVARMARATSAFGAQLDSLGDLVSFGVAPALLVRTVADGAGAGPRILWLVCAVYLVCAALRLARYNVRQAGEKSTHDDFEGLPTPAAAGVVAALVLLGCSRDARLPDAAREVVFAALPFAAVALGILMVSSVRYVHVPNRLLRGKRPFTHVVQITFAALLAAYWIEVALALAFVGYLLHGLMAWGLARRATTFSAADESPSDTPLDP